MLCDRVPLRRLAEQYGTPLYVYSAQGMRARLALFARHFAGQEHLVCYAVKANSNLAVLKLMAEHGAGFDIVSGGELERVLHVQRRAARRTVFSGVGKTAAEIDLALRNRILLFNVESEAELDLLAERASRLRRRAPIALRVNPDVFAETHPYISTGLREHKFGLDITTAPDAYRRASRSRWLEPVGVSVHIGSQIRSAQPFASAVSRVAELVRSLRTEGIALRTIDAGGGLGIDYHEPLRPTSDSGSRFNPEAAVRAYADELRRALGDLDVQLLLEPGRFLVAQAGALLARVLSTKTNGDKRFIITDAGMNDLLRPALYGAHHEITPVQRAPNTTTQTVDVVGPVCETGDFFARDRELPQRRKREPGRSAGCRSVRDVAELELQHASARGGGAGGRPAHAAGAAA